MPFFNVLLLLKVLLNAFCIVWLVIPFGWYSMWKNKVFVSLFSSVCPFLCVLLHGGSMVSMSSKGICLFSRSKDFLNARVMVYSLCSLAISRL